MSFTYGIYIYPDVAALDFSGPYEVFDLSCFLLQQGRVVTIADSLEPVKCASGMEVLPQYDFNTAPELDLILIPGANNTAAALASDTAQEWLKSVADKVRFVTAVCTGSLVLQRAGLLAGKKATTHWMLIDELAADDSVTVLPDMRYVRDGNVVTSQGVSAGIDMALWLVGQLHTPIHAREVQKVLHYEPAPPYQAAVD